ncbi:hypothetical protein [Lapidilactobacillus gannanensis]|uniref:Mga helix-turn-helix domain-containing protein n=1 Tax=Lapidilactobacillus gannanensis TaxID=2486002 RepID=A0ABW4BMV6_9LACO|nr:hypothetical protein [Lapidilactobacillus gannanensis]
MNQEEIAKVAVAVRGLPSIRLPFPEHIDQVGLQRDLNQVSQLLSDAAEDSEVAFSYLSEVVLMERLFFNRSLQQITVDSLADVVLVALPTVERSDDELDSFVTLIFYFCQLLTDNGIITNNSLMGTKFIEAIQRRQPELTDEITGDEAVGSRLEMGIMNHFFTQPLQLLPAGLTSFFNQEFDLDVDFNEFLAEIQQKNDPALFEAALLLFVEDEPSYLKVLNAANKPFSEIERFYPFWARLNLMSPAGLLKLLQSYQDFLDFCVVRAVMSRTTAQKIWQSSSRRLLSYLYADAQQAVTVGQSIFSGPAQRLNPKMARKILQDQPYTATLPFELGPAHPLKLAKKLDQHQLDLELKRVQGYLRDFTGNVTLVELPELTLFTNFILKLHRTMVLTYHRRVNQWTYESLRNCLEHILVREQQFVGHPLIFRFLQLYLFTLDDEGAIKNADILYTALEHEVQVFLYHSIDVQTATSSK